MSHCGRKGEFARKIDGIDQQIADLVRIRDDLMKKMPADYDSCGEGEIYFRKISDFGHAEQVYHSIAEID